MTPCVCICLSGQEERYDRCAKEFCRVGLCRIVDFYRPTKHVLTDKEKRISKRAGTIGCFRSHQKVAKEVGLAHDGVTVFEDDVIFRDGCVRHEPAVYTKGITGKQLGRAEVRGEKRTRPVFVPLMTKSALTPCLTDPMPD